MNTYLSRSIPEEFLYYIWENRLYNKSCLISDGHQIEIISPGIRNRDSGPDFFNSKIKIGKTTWAGNVEIHKKSSDWMKHKHQNDDAYSNVILHVVEKNDQEIVNRDGHAIPTVEIDYPNNLKENYLQLLHSTDWIPCEKQIHKANKLQIRLGFNRLMIERLENKTDKIINVLNNNNSDWNETFYQMIAQIFGFKVNAVPFELLAKNLPLKVLTKHKNSLFQIEALLFGTAGFLSDQLFGDEYYNSLKKEYDFLSNKYKLKPTPNHLWKFMRLRPTNFPTIRIAQFANLIHKSSHLFSKILAIEDFDKLIDLFEEIEASKYWQSHYSFNKESKKTSKKSLGKSSIQVIIINVVVPFLFVYGEKQNLQNLKDRALTLLEKLPPEKNSIIAKWRELGVNSHSAFDSQALLQLKNCYCNAKKCLNCQIGIQLLKKTN